MSGVQVFKVRRLNVVVDLVDAPHVSHAGPLKVDRGNVTVKRPKLGYISLGRLIMERALGRPLKHGEYVGHKNGCGLDLRRENLQLVVGNKTWRRRFHGVKPVVYASGRVGFHVQFTLKKRKVFLGVFDTPEEGALAYDEAMRKHHGDTPGGPRVNFPDFRKSASVQKLAEAWDDIVVGKSHTFAHQSQAFRRFCQEAGVSA